MAKLSDKQKERRKFRSSKIWRDFRHQKNIEQNGLDPITMCKLTKTFNNHHRKLDLENESYCKIDNPNEFIGVNSSTHEVIHWCLRYIKKYHDMRVVDNLYNEVLEEAKLNGLI